MAISSQEVAAAYNPLIRAVDREAYRDSIESNANINFDNRVARQAYPITRMFDPTGKVNRSAIANATPYEDASQMWEQLNANMPRGRGIDPAVFQEKYQAGKQMYDMNLANQLNQMKQAGMSTKKIRKQFEDNPELRQYMYENGLLEVPKHGMKWSKAAMISAGAYGGVKGAQLLGPAYVTEAAKSQLGELGLKHSKKYKSIVTMNHKELTAKYMKEGMSRTEAIAESKKVRDALAASKKSYMGKQALKPGSGIGKRIGTRAVLQNVAKTVGPKVGKGLLGAAGRGLLGGGPYGMAANVALFTAPWIWDKLTDE